jgi:hypothetical protein
MFFDTGVIPALIKNTLGVLAALLLFAGFGPPIPLPGARLPLFIVDLKGAELPARAPPGLDVSPRTV